MFGFKQKLCLTHTISKFHSLYSQTTEQIRFMNNSRQGCSKFCLKIHPIRKTRKMIVGPIKEKLRVLEAFIPEQILKLEQYRED